MGGKAWLCKTEHLGARSGKTEGGGGVALAVADSVLQNRAPRCSIWQNRGQRWGRTRRNEGGKARLCKTEHPCARSGKTGPTRNRGGEGWGHWACKNENGKAWVCQNKHPGARFHKS